MSASTYSVGNTGRSSAACLADKAAQHLASFQRGAKRAVCIDPRGRVTVEPVTSACEVDLIGVYICARMGSWVSLAALIERDIKHHIGEPQRRAA